MTTLYNGTLTVQGLFTPVVGPSGITSADTIVSFLNNIGYSSEQRVMMEIGSYNTNGGNYGNIYKYALGFSNSNNGSGGSFLIQACPVSTNTYSAVNPPITLFTLNTTNLSVTVPLNINGSFSLYNSGLQFNVGNTGVVSFQSNVWHTDVGGVNRIFFSDRGGTTYFGTGKGYGFVFSAFIHQYKTDDLLTIDGRGNLVAIGDITAFSDVRFKENIVPIDSPLEKINAMRGVYYTRIDAPGPRHVGVIAQEIEEVLPEVVLTSGPNGNKSVAYANMVALLIEGIKEQGKLITTLQSTVIEQQSTIQDLQDSVKELQSKASVIQYTLEEEQATIKFLQPMVLDLEMTTEEHSSTISILHPAVLELQANVEEQQSRITILQPMVLDLQETIKEEQSTLETLQEIIGSLENLNTPVEVNEDEEVDTESSVQTMD